MLETDSLNVEDIGKQVYCLSLFKKFNIKINYFIQFFIDCRNFDFAINGLNNKLSAIKSFLGRLNKYDFFYSTVITFLFEILMKEYCSQALSTSPVYYGNFTNKSVSRHMVKSNAQFSLMPICICSCITIQLVFLVEDFCEILISIW